MYERKHLIDVSLPFSLPSSLSKNKRIKFVKRIVSAKLNKKFKKTKKRKSYKEKEKNQLSLHFHLLRL